jgi:hypothetical protein
MTEKTAAVEHRGLYASVRTVNGHRMLLVRNFAEHTPWLTEVRCRAWLVGQARVALQACCRKASLV